MTIDRNKGQVDDDGRTFYVRGDESGVTEATRVKLSSSEDATCRSRGEVQVRRGNREITLSSDGGKPEVGVVYYDNED